MKKIKQRPEIVDADNSIRRGKNGELYQVIGYGDNRPCLKVERFPDTGMNYVAYTDGSCDNYNPHRPPGAGYVILKDDEVVKVNAKGFLHTTNNRMELLAIISACNCLPEGAYVDIYSDSQYAIYTLLYGGKKNTDLMALYARCTSHLAGVQFHWLKSHNGDKYNELADTLANTAYKEICKEYHIPTRRL